MKVIDGFWSDVELERDTVVTFGKFDALHRGHRAVFRKALRRAREADRDAAALFLHPNPLKLLAPERCPPSLTTLPQKLRLMESFGLDTAIIGRFDERLRSTEAVAFLERLATRFRAKTVAVGYSVRFGLSGTGNVETIEEHADRLGYDLLTVGAEERCGDPISSTRVRLAVQDGDLKLAEDLLGRPYSICGEVVKGDQVGRELGFPTANVDFSDLQLPPLGIYAGRAVVDGREHDAAISLGVRPTFGGKKTLLEAYLLDFTGDLYGNEVEVTFVEKLRDELRFDSVDALKERMRLDVRETRAVLAATPD